MKVKDYVYDPDRKTATIWLEDIKPGELEENLKHLESEQPKQRKILEHDQVMLDAIKEMS